MAVTVHIMPRTRAARPQTIATPTSFKKEVEPAMRAVRASFHALVAAVPGPVRRAIDLRRALGLSAELSWQTFRVATASDPASIGPFIPRPGSVRRLVEAAEANGISREITQSVVDAHEQYERLIAHHAGDRASFNAIIEGAEPNGDGGISIKDRRAAFRANRNLWGVQATARTGTFVFVPDSPAGSIDGAGIAGLIDLYAVRPLSKLCMEMWGDARDETGRQLAMEHLASPDDPWASVGLLREFSSPDLPPLETQARPDGITQGVLTLPGVGRSSALSLYYTHAARGVASGTLSAGGFVQRPCEVMIVDMLVARSEAAARGRAAATVYARVDQVDKVNEMRPEDKLPWNVPVDCIGSVREIAPIPEASQYVQAVASVLRRHGWADREFDQYRVRIEYPILHSFINLSVEPVGK